MIEQGKTPLDTIWVLRNFSSNLNLVQYKPEKTHTKKLGPRVLEKLSLSSAMLSSVRSVASIRARAVLVPGLVCFPTHYKFKFLIIFPATKVRGHCQVPCGIFDDPVRVASLKEDAATIRKVCMNVLTHSLRYEQSTLWRSHCRRKTWIRASFTCASLCPNYRYSLVIPW